MNKKLEEAIKTLKITKNVTNNYRIQEAIETVLQALDNSISTEVIEKKIEKATEEYKYILDNIDKKTSHMKDEHKIRGIYAEFGVKKGRLEILEELLEQK